MTTGDIEQRTGTLDAMEGKGGEGTGGVVLGLSFDFHDAAASLLVDGEIVAAVEEERLSRVKHDARLPELATAACLEIAGLAATDVDDVVFYEKPLMVAARFLATKQRQGPRSVRSFTRDAPKVLGSNLMAGYRVGRLLQRLGARRPPRLQFVEHHMSHAASAFYPSPFERAAVLTIDGVGEWATATIGHGIGREISLLEELRFPNSVGLIYSFVTAFCGFRPNDDEYKVMGLAPYGEPRFAERLAEVVQRADDGSIRVDGRTLDWFAPRALTGKRLADLFDGPPRDPDGELTTREADLAASVQQLTEEVVLALGARARELTEEDNVCLAGGVALNCVANGRLLREGPFSSMWVQPAAGDAGGSLGAALAYWHQALASDRTVVEGQDSMSGSFLGQDVSPAEVDAALDARGLTGRRIDDVDELAREVAERIADGAIVGWFRGRMEFGPRALGHRSLLADPRSADVRHRLNAITKGRESFRPFAPAVLADRAAEWFDLDQSSPYMLIVAPVRDDKRTDVEVEPDDFGERGDVVRSEIPACTHVDWSARVQTVSAEANPDLHRLITAFERATGCPMVVNTSFNRAGEPVVATPDQAIASAGAGRVDLLVLGDVLVEGADLRDLPEAADEGANAEPEESEVDAEDLDPAKAVEGSEDPDPATEAAS